MADILTGNDFMFYIPIGGVNRPICRSKDTRITLSAESQETTTKDGGNGRRYEYVGKTGYSLTVNALTNLIDVANFSYIQDALLSVMKLPFVFTDNSGVSYSGTVLIQQVDLDSPDNAVSSFNTTFLGDGPLVKAGGPLPPVGDQVQIIDQFGTILASVTAPGIYSVLKYDTIDEAGWALPDLIIIEGE